MNSKTSDLDVIKHVFNNREIISNWIISHPTLPSEEFLLKNLVFTVVTISQEKVGYARQRCVDCPILPSTSAEVLSNDYTQCPMKGNQFMGKQHTSGEHSQNVSSQDKNEYDSSLPLAWTFFNAVNSGGKHLSDYDLLKAHHLRYLSSYIRDDSLIQYKAGIWDSNGEQKIDSFYGEKLSLYEVSFAHTFYLIRSWLKNRSIIVSDLPADSRYCILHHYSALLSILHADEAGVMTGLTSGVIGGKPFFDWTEYWMWQFRIFCENPVVKSFNEIPWAWPQRHLRIIARALLFYYFSKFGDLFLADACIFILYRIGRLRNTSARKKNAWYGNDSKGDQCVPHTITAIEESPSPEYFFHYCMMPSNRYVRHYNLKDDTQNKDRKRLLRNFNLGPDWWKRLLVFAASNICLLPAHDVPEECVPFPSDMWSQSPDKHIGGSICYKKEIADLLNAAAKEFGWDYNRETLELEYKS